ncbi:MAG: Cof-type HAD-IIB family hydrolase [Lachnospiraceae bacterium]|nr:Cof-type HAD-IIB family hydrolase [Lachnospiraceae bacterium]
MDKKILFTDLDGTLLKDDKNISDITRNKIIQMLLDGNHFVLASGRPVKSILDVLDSIQIKAAVLNADKSTVGGIYATAYNGALIYDCIADRSIEEYRVPMDISQQLFDMAIEAGIHIHTYISNTIISIAEDKELEFYTRNVKLPFEVETKLIGKYDLAPFKLIAIDLEDRGRLESFRQRIEESELGKIITCAFSNDNYLEFYSNKAGKGKALINLCKYLEIPVENAIAAGDEENDVSMVSAAGIGVALANANPILKNIADYVTDNDNNHDGMVEIIDKFV